MYGVKTILLSTLSFLPWRCHWRAFVFVFVSFHLRQNSSAFIIFFRVCFLFLYLFLGIMCYLPAASSLCDSYIWKRAKIRLSPLLWDCYLLLREDCSCVEMERRFVCVFVSGAANQASKTAWDSDKCLCRNVDKSILKEWNLEEWNLGEWNVGEWNMFSTVKEGVRNTLET